MAFAPRQDPQIAISVYVENAGFGATWAAPIASLMIEKFINGEIDPKRKWIEDRILSMSTIGPAKPIAAKEKAKEPRKPAPQAAEAGQPKPQTQKDQADAL